MSALRPRPDGRVVRGAGWQPPRAIRSRSLLDAARSYGAEGWPVLPVAGVSSAGECGCGRSCESPGKHPLSRHGVHDATTDSVLIEEWWRRSPGANVGIATGAASGLIVVDLDLRRGGRESLQTLVAAGLQLAPTLTSHTGGRGQHLFYAQPSGIDIPNAVGHLPGLAQALPGVDLRGNGGYVVAPPSIHASGRRYRWDRRQIAALPSWMLPRPMVPTPATTFCLTGGASAYGAAALSRELEAVRGLDVVDRNDGLHRAAFCLGRLVGGGELAEALVLETLLCGALAVGLGESEAAATIRSGLRAGMAVPRRAPEGNSGWQPLHNPRRR
ncbi:MAG TPA: bifunctional DNA primase/polymerase [Acidimicrobiales bacterium]|nr:bifunctional DNA primase/polymerase [Acidimicrobiales bacterium]